MTDNDNKQIRLRIEKLHQKREKLLSLPANKALSYILETEEQTALVHSIPEQDLYFLINDIGPDDALPVLALASRQQWEYILDLKIWQRDRIDMGAITRWLDLFYRANARQTVKWLLEENSDLFELFLSRSIEVKIREHDQDPSEYSDDFTSLDNVFYVRIASPLTSAESELGDVDKENIRTFLSKLMESVANFDYISFQKILLETINVLPAEGEEEIYRIRNLRLAEKGFLPFEEAVGVYQPLDPDRIPRRTSGNKLQMPNVIGAAAPHFPVALLDHSTPFADGLARIDDELLLRQLQIEFAGLCNRIAAADFTKVNSKEDLKSIVQKSSGYLSIGLHTLSGDSVANSRRMGEGGNRYASLIQHYLLSDIFRVGYSRALKLKWRAQKWMDLSWFAHQGLSLTFWDEDRLGVLGGLLIKKPMLFDNYRSGQMYREFGTEEDLQNTETVLNEIIAIDKLFSLLDIELGHLSHRRFLTYKNLLLTLWALDRIGGGKNLRLLKIAEFRDFFRLLWQHDGQSSRIQAGVKTSFLRWLCERSGLDESDISESLLNVLEGLFMEIEDEYGRVDPSALNPRHMYLFLLER